MHLWLKRYLKPAAVLFMSPLRAVPAGSSLPVPNLRMEAAVSDTRMIAGIGVALCC